MEGERATQVQGAGHLVIPEDNTEEFSEIDSFQKETTLNSLWYDDSGKRKSQMKKQTAYM